jgi:hypothetical protein
VKGYDPTDPINEYEQTHLFLSFCSLITLLNTKKLNLANVFILMLKNQNIRELFRTYCDLSNDFSAIKFFLQFDSGLYKSKYVMKFLNLNKKKLFV